MHHVIGSEWCHDHCMENADIERYSTEQLRSALEGIDAVRYPERALLIYQNLLRDLNLTPAETTAATLGYRTTSDWVDCLLSFLPYIDPFKGDWDLLVLEMEEKVNHLNQQLCR